MTRSERVKELHSQIQQSVEEFQESDRWAKFLDTVRNFHSYSLNNVLLIHYQMPEATRCAGFVAWTRMGRQVRKGEKGIGIFGYATKKVDEEDPETGEVERKTQRPVRSRGRSSHTSLHVRCSTSVRPNLSTEETILYP